MIRRTLLTLGLLACLLALYTTAALAANPSQRASTVSHATTIVIAPHPHSCAYATIRFPYHDRQGSVRWLAGDPGVCFNHHTVTVTRSSRVGGPGVFYETLTYSRIDAHGHVFERAIGRASICPSAGIVKVRPPDGFGAEETLVKTY